MGARLVGVERLAVTAHEAEGSDIQGFVDDPFDSYLHHCITLLGIGAGSVAPYPAPAESGRVRRLGNGAKACPHPNPLPGGEG
ncbi:hypothetical protein D3C76_1596570 [compost metagenome]